MSEHYFFISEHNYNFDNLCNLKIDNVKEDDIPLILSMVDSNFNDVVVTIQYNPKLFQLNIFSKKEIELLGWNYKASIINCFTLVNDEQDYNVIDYIKTILDKNKDYFDTAISYEANRYEKVLKDKSIHNFLLFIKPNEDFTNLIVAIGKDDGSASKFLWQRQDKFIEDKILNRILQLYCLKNTYKIPIKRETNFPFISLIINNNEIVYEILINNKKWYIKDRDILKWISNDDYESFGRSLKINLSMTSNWFDDAFLLSSHKKRTRV